MRENLVLPITGTFSIGSSVGVEKETYALNDTDAFLGNYLDMLVNSKARKGMGYVRKFLPDIAGRNLGKKGGIIVKKRGKGYQFNPHLKKMLTEPTYFASVFKTGYTDDKIKEYFPNAQGRNLGTRLFLFEGENYTDALDELDVAEIDYQVNEDRQLVLLDEMLSDEDFFEEQNIIK